jgi:drug/metabolite transporter (DMT)-like permease
MRLYGLLQALRLLDRAYAPSSVVLASLAAASCYAIAAVLQQSAAVAEDPALSLRPALVASLVRRRRWLLGVLASVGGYAFQFLALRRGSLALVEPLLVASLVIALPLNALVEHRKLTAREWAPGLAIVGALTLFLLAARPGRGAPRASAGAWILLACLTLGAVTACVRHAGAGGPRRAVALGSAAGILFGVTGAVTETTGHLLDHGIAHVFASWAPYALILAGVAGLIINQSAFQAGELRWSLPAITILEPLVAILIGELMFHEHIAGGVLARSEEILGLTGMTLGVLTLARSQVQRRPPGTEGQPLLDTESSVESEGIHRGVGEHAGNTA